MRPEQIRIEATERGFLDAEAAKEVIKAFRDAGHPVYIDDFGTGYSSLSHLQNFHVDALKIDKSFVDTIGQDAASSSVASHIIEMAATLQVQVIAEGIEREEQAAYLHARGAQFGQGGCSRRRLPRRSSSGISARRARVRAPRTQRVYALRRRSTSTSAPMNDQSATTFLNDVRHPLLALHRSVLTDLRVKHEAEFGPVSPGQSCRS